MSGFVSLTYRQRHWGSLAQRNFKEILRMIYRLKVKGGDALFPLERVLNDVSWSEHRKTIHRIEECVVRCDAGDSVLTHCCNNH